MTVGLLAIAALAGACERAPLEPGRTGSVTLPAEVTIEEGEHRRLAWEYRDASGQVVAATAHWTSSDEGIASVDTGGVVRGRSAGVTTIVARVDGVADTTLVAVRAVELVYLRLRPDTAEVVAGTRFPLFAHGTGVGARSRDWRPGQLRWSSGDTAIARVDTLGVVEGVAPGVVDITVAGGGRADTLRLTVRPPVRFTQVSAGRAHTCAVGAGSGVFCWGDADFAALGALTAAEFCNQYGCKLMPARSPVPVARSAGLTSVAASPGLAWYTHSCALNPAGQALCWGSLYPPQVGETPYSGCTAGGSLSRPCSFAPLPVEIPAELRSVGAGLGFSCGLTRDGEVYCWGANASLMVGEGADGRGTPARVPTEHRFVALSTGDLHACALDAEGAAFCWGYNHLGQLGMGDTVQRAVPTRAAGDLRFASIDAGTGVTCGVTPQGAVHCWGGQPGGVAAGAAAARAKSLVFRSVEVGESHACAIGPGGEGYCWGSNGSGELGSGAASADVRPEPTLVAGNHRWQTLSAGVGYTCGITVEGDAYCWGSNSTGQLGIASEDPSRPMPTRVAGQAAPAS